jgi:ribonuclease P protein subunit RPR2
MAKGKPPKVKGVSNKHLHVRTTFLYQAATYLTLHASAAPLPVKSDFNNAPASHADTSHIHGCSGLALELGSQLHTVSRKGQVRLSAELKRSLCKQCNTILIPGRTSTQSIVNESKGGRKPWADVLVILCTFCNSTKRFPVGATRQKRKSERSCKVEQNTSKDESTTPIIQSPTDQSTSPG